MGIVHATRGRRLAPAVIVIILALLALVVAFATIAQPAAAYDHPNTDTFKHKTASSCTSCHASISGPVGTPTNELCTTCHSTFDAHARGGVASNCWSACHLPGQDMAAVEGAGCGTGAAGAACHNGPGHVGSDTKTCVSCHGTVVSGTDPGQSAHHKAVVTDVTVAPLLTIKLSGTSVKVKKSITASGLAKPVNATYKVTVLIQKKSSTGKWAKVAIKPAAPNATSYAWLVSYKPLKTGSYRLQASVPAVLSTTTPGVTAVSPGVSVWKTFKVK